eukprot:scaffold29018_cov60-Attheya_sp.AAC.1
MEGVARIGGCALAVVRDYSGATRLAVREDYRLAGLGGVRGVGLARLHIRAGLGGGARITH